MNLATAKIFRTNLNIVSFLMNVEPSHTRISNIITIIMTTELKCYLYINV
jgi:hypothetical protein